MHKMVLISSHEQFECSWSIYWTNKNLFDSLLPIELLLVALKYIDIWQSYEPNKPRLPNANICAKLSNLLTDFENIFYGKSGDYYPSICHEKSKI